MCETLILWLITAALALVLGVLFMKWHVPGGLLVGAMIVFATMQGITGEVWIARGTKEVAQLIAGCFIGASLTLEDLKRLPSLWKAFLVIVIGLIILNISVGLIIAGVSDLSLITALFSAIPGGMNTIPIISADYGADPVVVTVFQFVRMVMGVGVFPSIVVYISNRFNGNSPQMTTTQEMDLVEVKPKQPVKKQSISSFMAVLLASIFALIVFHYIPGLNLMVLALIGLAVLNLTIGVQSIPILYRRIAQFLSGWYIGTQFYAEQLNTLVDLLVPVLILIPLFLVGCLVIGYFVHKIQKMPLTDSLLASIPAGASDVVLILDDLNITNADIVVLQVLRLIAVTSIFPPIAAVVAYLLS